MCAPKNCDRKSTGKNKTYIFVFIFLFLLSDLLLVL
jgi:hypothetical protein